MDRQTDKQHFYDVFLFSSHERFYDFFYIASRMNISSRLFGNLNILYCLIWCFCSPKRTHFNLIHVESYRSIKVNRMALLRMASLIPLNIRHKAKTLCYFPKAKTLLTDSCLYRSINLYIVKPNPDISSNFTNSARNYQDLKHFRWIKINLRNQKATSNNSMMRNISNLRKCKYCCCKDFTFSAENTDAVFFNDFTTKIYIMRKLTQTVWVALGDCNNMHSISVSVFAEIILCREWLRFSQTL